MNVHIKRLIKDFLFISLGISLSIFLTKTGVLEYLLHLLRPFQYLLVFVSGFFFPSIFTAVPAIVVLMHLTEYAHPFLLALIGGLGAALSDYLFFKYMRTTILEDASYLLSITEHKLHIRFFSIFKTKLFRFLTPFVGALVIILPLPDELGVMLLSLSDVKPRIFVLISYSFHVIGIFSILMIGASLLTS